MKPEFIKQWLVGKETHILRVVVGLVVPFNLFLWNSRKDAFENA